MPVQLLPRLAAWLAFRHEVYRLSHVDRRLLADMGFDPEAPAASLRRRSFSRKG